MNKRQAKIYALEIAAGILYSSTDTMELDMPDSDHAKVVAEVETIAASLEKRARRLGWRGFDKWIGQT